MLPREGSINDNVTPSFPKELLWENTKHHYLPPALQRVFFRGRVSKCSLIGEMKRVKNQKTPVQASAHLFYLVSVDPVFFLFFFFLSHRYEQNNFTFFIEFLKPDYILLNNYFEIKLLTFNTTIQFVFAFVCVNFSGFVFFFFRCS